MSLFGMFTAAAMAVKSALGLGSEERSELPEWKAIEGEVGYEVSRYGEVRSLPRTIEYIRNGKKCERKLKGKILKAATQETGYLCVVLPNAGSVNVHVLVARAYVPNPNCYRTVNHIDGDKTNNNSDNIEWATHSQNMQHAYDTGLKGRCNRLTWDIVNEIRANGELHPKVLAEKFGTTPRNVRFILAGKTWVKKEEEESQTES